MRLIGLNRGVTSFGKRLKNGSLAAMEDGKVVFGLGEERLTRLKEDGGYAHVLPLCLELLGWKPETIDYIGISTCCEPERPTDHVLLPFDLQRIIWVNHHLSHAHCAFYLSGFQQSLVAVMDGGGNTHHETRGPWWLVERDQVSYYLAGPKGIRLLARDFSQPQAVGFGEAFRAFSYFLGWPSSRHASNVMALAGHGDASSYGAKSPFGVDNNQQLTCAMVNDPPQPVQMVLNLGRHLGVDFGPPRLSGDPVDPRHANVAAFLQRSTEEAILLRLSALREATGATQLCLAGGVALNCRLNGRILSDAGFDAVFVPPCPGDEGQALGNVLFLYYTLMQNTARLPFSTYLGPEYRINSNRIARALAEHLPRSVVIDSDDVSRRVAESIALGEIVCRFDSRSEYGPRALGNRSILADPRRAGLASILGARIKSRENFQPFAPSVLEEEAPSFFRLKSSSPYMNIAFEVLPEKLSSIPAVVHRDGSSRVHTVSHSIAPEFYRLIKDFRDLTGIPLVLNTSLNRNDEPIVETPEDALRMLVKVPIDIMAIGRFLVLKNVTPRMLEGGLLKNLHLRDGVMVGTRKGEETWGSSDGATRELISWLQDRYPGRIVFIRTTIPLYDEYLEWAISGRKVTTIRIRKGGVEIPYQEVMKVYPTTDFGVPEKQDRNGRLRILGLKIKEFGLLNQTDAVRDGFGSLDELRSALSRIYGSIDEEHPVTIYSIAYEKREAA